MASRPKSKKGMCFVIAQSQSGLFSFVPFCFACLILFVPSLSKLEVEPLRTSLEEASKQQTQYTESTLKHLAKKVEDTGHGSCCFLDGPGWKTLFGTKKQDN